jgi:AcrR family transcriptional regulator
MPRGAEPLPLRKGEITKRGILDEAVQMASVHGLDGLSIGDLADAAGMSKAGLFAHFGSKEELQLATVEAARELFRDAVLGPALKAPKGLPRLCFFLAAWISYGGGNVFKGGCFFRQVAAEFDSRPGAVRDAVVEAFKALEVTFARLIEESVKEGHLKPQADPRQLAFELQSILMNANDAWALYHQAHYYEMARRAMRDRLQPLLRKNQILIHL